MKFICETTVWQANIQVIGEKRAVSVIQLFSVALHMDHKMAVLSNGFFLN